MKNSESLKWIDLVYIIGVCIFFFSCIGTTLQVSKTLKPGQVEASAGYMQARSFDEFSETPVQLFGINGRVGIINNLDAGIEHTFDISEGNEGAFKTIWGDAKWQLTNKNNEFNKLTFSTGLLKGYAYDEEAEIHFTSLPLYFSLPVNDRLTPTFMYRYGLLNDDFFPNSDSFDNPRHTFSLGLEYCLKKPDPQKWTPKLGIGIGTMNSLTGDPDGDNLFLISFGFKFTSPIKK